jgi:hypothetical protein
MIVLFQLGGADDFTILQDALSPEKSRTLLDNSARLDFPWFCRHRFG